MRDFLWKGCDNDKADHLVASERIARSMEKRGHGMGNSLKRNEVFLGKWLRRFPWDQSLRYKVIVSKYGLKEICGTQGQLQGSHTVVHGKL